jgi:tetratricopeptide (TPR) repeat protein
MSRATLRSCSILLLLSMLVSWVPWPLIGARMAFAGVTEDRRDLEKAWQKYRENSTHQALDTAAELVRRRNLQGPELRDAWALKALCESDLGDHSAAVASFKAALELDPAWRIAGADYTPGELEDFRRALDESRAAPRVGNAAASKRGGRLKYYLGGALVVAVGVVLAGGGGGDKGLSDLPAFPNPPGGR